MPMNPRLLRPRARQAGALPPDPNANLRSGLIAFYPLSNGSDSSGNGRNLTATNITYQSGKIGNGAYFDGTAYFATSSLPAFTGANMTIAGWFKNIGEDYEDFLIGAGAVDNSLYIVRVGGDIKASASESNVENFAGGSGADDGNWHFFAVTRTATRKKVWLDETVNSVGGTYGAMNNPTPFAIGSNFNNTYLLLDGMMDAVGIWDRALSDAEIAQLYNAGAGLEISATPPVAPDAPTAFSGTAGNGQVSLSWTAPASNGGAAITDYTVQFSSNGGSTWSTFADGTSTATSATVTGLTNGTAYVFRVAAVNAAGTGAYTAASSSVTPAVGLPTIAGLQLHLDSSDASTLYNATTGGSLVAVDGAVARWEDKSGNGRHATQATSGRRPLRKANQRNSLDAIEFNGTSHFLDFSSELSFAQYTAFAVVKRSSISGVAGVFCADDPDGIRASQMIRVNGGAPESISFSSTGGGAATASSSLTVSANEWFVATARQTSSALAIYKNATAGASVSATHHSTAVSPTLGRVLKSIADNFLWNGNIAEIILYNSALSDAGRAAVESYLMTKWGIS